MSKDRFPFGKVWNPETGRRGHAVTVDLDEVVNGVIMAETGGGKGATIEIPARLLPGLEGVNIVGLDPAGQNAAVTWRWRSMFSDFQPLNPMNVHGLGDVGCNPMLSVKDFQGAMRVGEAMLEVKPNAYDAFFPEAAQRLIGGVVLAVAKDCLVRHDVPTLGQVVDILTGDLEGFAAHMEQCGDFQLKSLLSQYQKSNRTIDSIKLNAHNATTWTLDHDISKSMSVPKGIDWTQLKYGARPQTIELILAAEALVTFAPWLRLMMVSAFNTLYQLGGGGRKTVFMLSEFYALGRIGPSFTNAMTQIRKFGGRIFPIVLQNIEQISEIYGPHGASTILGNSGALLALRPAPMDDRTVDFLSRNGGTHWVPEPSVSDDPETGICRTNWSLREQPVWPPEKIRSLPDYHGLLFTKPQGQDAVRVQPVWLPRYFKLADGTEEMPELRGRYDADPYHPSPSPASSPTRRKVFAMGGAASMAAIAGGVWLSNAGGPGRGLAHDEKPVVRVDPRPSPLISKPNPPAPPLPAKPQHVTRR